MNSFKKHALKLSREYTQANFALVLSIVVSLVFLINSFNYKEGTIKSLVFTIFLVYALFTLYQFFLTWKIKKNLLKFGAIQPITRKLGYIQLLSILSANVFTASFAFNLIKNKKTPDYTFAVYMLFTQLFVIAISAFNMFKPYVTDTFLPAMGILVGILVFQVVTLILVSKYVQDESAPSWFLVIAIVLIASSVTGNLFNLLLGISLIVKIRSHDRSRIIKWNTIWGKITRNSTAILGMFFIILMLSLSVCSKYTFDYDMAVENDYGSLLQQPSLEHPFGTDDFGRDLFSRIIFGARISLLVGFASTIIPLIIGGSWSNSRILYKTCG